MADLKRSPRIMEPLDDELLLEEFLGAVDTLLMRREELRSNGPQRIDRIVRRVEVDDQYDIAAAARDFNVSAKALFTRRDRDLAGALQQSAGMVSRGCQGRLVAKLCREMNRCLDHSSSVIASARIVSRAN